MRRALALGLLQSVVACGGAVAKDKPRADATGGTSAAMPGTNPIQVIDDLDHVGSPYPPVPPGSPSFFWRGGLGNWFVTSSDGSSGDAPIDETVESGGQAGKACHISGKGQGVQVDLWAQLNHPSGQPVDLSAYSGVGFKARVVGSSRMLVVAFDANGQFFADGAAFPQQLFATSEVWQTFTLKFDDLGLVASAVSSLDFVVAEQSDPFELWVDDLALLCKGTCP